jgi:hypothetical protein
MSNKWDKPKGEITGLISTYIWSSVHVRVMSSINLNISSQIVRNSNAIYGRDGRDWIRMLADPMMRRRF